ncbi:MAG: fatty acid hydroxylase [Gammaproteobacteria bacterium]|nr:MAG: fatty acid hydroxylase [Gammaproteobacteria bacterium]
MSQIDLQNHLDSAGSGESIRLFKNDALETLSHVHPIVPLCIWSPLIVFLLYRSHESYHLSALTMLGLASAAILVWTFMEYFLHRFVFHFPARHTLTKYLVFTFHGVHHAAPQDKTRLVMPPAGAVIFLGLFWLLFEALLPDAWLGAFFAFFTVGYLIYDYIHYAIHHFPMKSPLANYLKICHLRHHFKTPDRCFGVSSPLWDIVFRTN